MSWQFLFRCEVGLWIGATFIALAAIFVSPDQLSRGNMSTAVVLRDPKSDAAAQDRAAENLLEGDNKAEARKWLASDKHVVWKWGREDAAKAVDELYKLGAVKVWVVDIHREDAAELASHFVVQLPPASAEASAAKRKEVFAWIEKWEDKADFDDDKRIRDVGQKYWSLDTDL